MASWHGAQHPLDEIPIKRGSPMWKATWNLTKSGKSGDGSFECCVEWVPVFRWSIRGKKYVVCGYRSVFMIK